MSVQYVCSYLRWNNGQARARHPAPLRGCSLITAILCLTLWPSEAAATPTEQACKAAIRLVPAADLQKETIGAAAANWCGSGRHQTRGCAAINDWLPNSRSPARASRRHGRWGPGGTGRWGPRRHWGGEPPVVAWSSPTGHMRPMGSMRPRRRGGAEGGVDVGPPSRRRRDLACISMRVAACRRSIAPLPLTRWQQVCFEIRTTGTVQTFRCCLIYVTSCYYFRPKISSKIKYFRFMLSQKTYTKILIFMTPKYY
jgi:hypothetical protein